MLTLSRIAYCEDLASIASWNCSLCREYPQVLSNVSTVSNTSLGMQLFVGVDKSDGINGSILVAFRGSEVLENYIKDLEFSKATPFPDCDGCHVHRGMYDTYALNNSK